MHSVRATAQIETLKAEYRDKLEEAYRVAAEAIAPMDSAPVPAPDAGQPTLSVVDLRRIESQVIQRVETGRSGTEWSCHNYKQCESCLLGKGKHKVFWSHPCVFSKAPASGQHACVRARERAESIHYVRIPESAVMAVAAQAQGKGRDAAEAVLHELQIACGSTPAVSPEAAMRSSTSPAPLEEEGESYAEVLAREVRRVHAAFKPLLETQKRKLENAEANCYAGLREAQAIADRFISTSCGNRVPPFMHSTWTASGASVPSGSGTLMKKLFRKANAAVQWVRTHVEEMTQVLPRDAGDVAADTEQWAQLLEHLGADIPAGSDAADASMVLETIGLPLGEVDSIINDVMSWCGGHGRGVAVRGWGCWPGSPLNLVPQG